jgi:O-antigen ligase
MLNERGMTTPIYSWLRYEDKSPIWRWTIVLGLLFSVAVLPWMLKEAQTILLVIGIVSMAGLLLLLRWPPLGIFATMIGGMLIPFRGPSGLNMAMIILAVALALWICSMLLHQKKISLVPSSTTVALLVMVVSGILSFGFGQLQWYSFAESAPLGAQVASLSLLILSAGAFLLVANQIRDIRWLAALVWVFLAFGAIYMLGRAVPVIGSVTNSLFQRGIHGSLLWVWLVALAFSQALFNRHLHPLWRIMLFGLVLLTFEVAYFQESGWKSGWVPPLIAIAATMVAYSWRLGLIMSPFAAVAGIALSGYLIETDAYSYSTRIDAWVIMTNLISENPILGLGWANYRWFTPLFPIRGYAVYFNSHSQYFDILAQTGIVGLISFLWFFVMVGWVGWKLRNRVPDGFPRAYVYGGLGGLVGTLVAGAFGDWVVPYFYNIGLTGFRASVLGWFFLGGLVVLEQLYGRNAEDKVEDEAEGKVEDKAEGKVEA